MIAPMHRPVSVLFPKNVDRVQSPMSALMLAIVRSNPEIHFFAFSSPETPEDHRLFGQIWALPNLHRVGPSALLLRRFDVVHHASAGRANFLASRWCRLRGGGRTRHLFTANCQPYPTHPRLDLLKTCVRKADHVVSVSRIVAEDFQREVGRASDAVIPNGYDASFYAPPPAEEAGREAFALYASALIDRKRPDFLLQVARAMPELRFLMVGPGREGPMGRHIVKEAASLPNVEVRGMIGRGDLRDLMRKARVFLHPSEYEGLPLAVIEAMGTGLPVLAQPCSSLPELITDGENGWLIPAQDPGPWVERIRGILAWSPERRHAYAKSVAEATAQRYAWESIGAAYGALYRRITGAERVAGSRATSNGATT